MSKGLRGLARQSLVFSLGMTVCLAILPFAVAPAASFLGKDVSQVAAGVISFYPWSAVWEVVRVIAAALAVFFLMALVPAAAARLIARRSRRWLVFPGLPMLAYLCWFAGAALKYPALFEGVLPQGVQKLVFHLAFHFRPHWFFAAAAVALLLPPVFLVARRPARLKALVLGQAAAPAALLALLLLAGGSEPARSTPERPNVLFIGVDSLRLDRLGRPDVTPHLQALLADPQTVQFRDHYVGIPRTFPSWLEMIQGRYAAKTGIRHMFPGFGERSRPFAGFVSELKAAGWRTTAVSDFAGDIFPRFEAGFDTVDAPKLTLMTMIRLSIDQTFSGFLPFMTTGPLRPLFPALKESPAFGDAEHLGEQALKYMPEDGGAPWLTTVFFSTAHFPYAAPYPYYAMFADRDYTGPFRFERNPDMGSSGGTDQAEVAQVRALYDGAVRSVDDELGRIFADLKARGLWDSTLIVVTADHGEDLFENGNLQGHGEHLRGENVLRVPLLVKLPIGRTPALHRVEFTTRSIDVGATVLGAAGVTERTGDGTDLTPWLTGAKTADPGLTAYAETGIWFARGGPGFFQEHRLDYPGISGLLSFDQGYSGEITLNPTYAHVITTAKHRMLIAGDWKIIYMPTPRGVEYELYDRRRDPANLHNLAAAEPARLSELRQQLLAFVGAQEAPKAKLFDDFVVPE